MAEATRPVQIRPEEVPRLRRRLTASIFGSIALGAIALMAALTVAPLVALEITGAATLTGLPGAFAVAGTAAGATLVSRVMAWRGRRRPGLVLGYAIAAAGALLAAGATVLRSFPLLLLAVVALGAGNSASNLARYAAADPYAPGRRSQVIGWVVWASTVGAVLGPTLGTAAGQPLPAVGVPALAGGFLVAAAGFALGTLAFGLLLRPDPTVLAAAAETLHVLPGAAAMAPEASPEMRRLALLGIVVSHSVMVLTMTMAPVHLRHHGTELGAIGLVMSSHTLGMFALTPVAGWLAHRLGNLTVLTIGLVLLMLAGIAAAAAPPGNAAALGGALFLLGLGWSCGFVAASGVLSQGPARERARRQGTADTLVFAAAAAASLTSGLVVALFSYATLALLGTAVAAGTGVVVLKEWRMAPR